MKADALNLGRDGETEREGEEAGKMDQQDSAGGEYGALHQKWVLGLGVTAVGQGGQSEWGIVVS